MPFEIKITAPGASQAATEIDKIPAALDSASSEASRLRAEFDKATERAVSFAKSTQSIGQKMADQFRTAQRALNDMLAQALDPAARGFAKLSEAIEREQAVVERIRGPIREYYADLVALDMAHKRGALTTAEFTAEMERLTASRRASSAAQAAQTIGTGAAPEMPGLKERALAVSAGLAGIGIATYALTEGANKIQGMVHAFQDIHDVWIEVSNAAIKFVDATRDVNRVVDEQIAVAHELHSNFRTTIGLYDTVRDGTDELNFSHRDQVRILETLGKASQVAGRSLDSVGGLVERLSYAAARGTIEQRELNTIMRQVPDIAELWIDKFGKTRKELLDLVQQGKISVNDLVAALATDYGTVDKNFEKIKRTGAQVRAEFNETIEMFKSKGYGWESSIGKALETIHPELVRKSWADLAVDFQEKAESIAKAADRAGDAIFHKLVKNLMEAPAYISASIDLLKGYGDQLGRVSGILSDPWGDDKVGFGAQIKMLRSIRQPIEDARIQLQNLRAEHVRGQITADEYRKQYEQLVTTINDGRLPATIRLWHELNDPIRDNAEAVAALNAAFESGGIGAAQYNTRMNAINDAMAKLRHETIAQEQAMRGVSIGPRASGVYVTAAAREQAALRPVESLTESAAALQPADLSKQAVALRDLNEAYARQFELAGQGAGAELEYEKSLQAINGALALHAISQERANQLTEQAKDGYQAAKDNLAGYASIVEQFEGPQKRYEDGLRAASAAFRDGRINAQQYGQAVDQIRSAYLQAAPDGKTFAGALEQTFLKAKIEAQSFGQQIADTLVDDVGKLSDALVTMAFDGEVSWRKMVDAMIIDLGRLAARQLAIGLINLGVNAISGGGGGLIPGVNAPITLPGQVARTGPGVYPMPAAGTAFAGSSSASSGTVVKIVNVFDRAEIHAAMDSREGEQITVNQMRRNAPAVRSYSGTRR